MNAMIVFDDLKFYFSPGKTIGIIWKKINGTIFSVTFKEKKTEKRKPFDFHYF